MRTQKARGIAALKNHSNWRIPPAHTVDCAEQLPAHVGKPVFVRPCPMRPRHGFVDSRICRTSTEVKAVWDEARAADPEAEIVIMRPITASCSAVLADGRLAIGPGHDGATAGHDVQELRVIPLPRDTDMLQAAGLGEDDSAYLELVFGALAGTCNERTHAVQLRAGPALPSGRDYIPRDTVVTTIVTPHDDLCRWESEVPAFPIGTVVVAPNGSLASHAAVHCVIHGVPFVTSRSVVVGETITATGEAPFSLDAAAFMRGSAAADARLADNHGNSCQLAVLVLHEWAALRGSGDAVASKLLGFACRTLARAGAAICVGEARHYSLKLKRQRATRITRFGRIDKTLRSTLTSQRRALTLAGKAFNGTGWKGGYGGKAWIECASAVDRLWRAQSGVLVEADLVSALNRVINVAHNNGALLTKLVDESYLNNAASAPTRLLLDRMGQLFAVLTDATSVAAAPLPKGGKIKRPVEKLYSCMHVDTENGGIKAHLWNPGEPGYVSHHIPSADYHLVTWVGLREKLSKSRHSNSSRGYAAIPLDAPIAAKTEAIIAALGAFRTGAVSL